MGDSCRWGSNEPAFGGSSMGANVAGSVASGVRVLKTRSPTTGFSNGHMQSNSSRNLPPIS